LESEKVTPATSALHVVCCLSQQRCAWNGFLDFLDPDSCCLQQNQERGFLCCSQSRTGFRFCVFWNTGSLPYFYLCRVKQESDC